MHKRLFAVTLLAVGLVCFGPIVVAGGDEEDRDHRYAETAAEIDAELAELEAERLEDLDEARFEFESELEEARRDAYEEGKRGKSRDKRLELEAKHYEKVNEIERDYANKRAEVLGRDRWEGGSRGHEKHQYDRHRHGSHPEEGLSEIHRELIKLDDELDRDLRKAYRELDRVLRQTDDEAAREGDRGDHARKRYELEIKHYEKIMKIEEKFAKKRAEILGARGSHERGQRSGKHRRSER